MTAVEWERVKEIKPTKGEGLPAHMPRPPWQQSLDARPLVVPQRMPPHEAIPRTLSHPTDHTRSLPQLEDTP